MKKIVALVKMILFLCMVFLLVLYCSAIFRPKKTEFPNDTSNKVNGFYALEQNTMDILFLGTSHTYYGFNPAIVYHETGLSSYVFAGECQPMSITYHYFKEALKTQSPKLIVLDVFSLLPSSFGCQTNGIYKKNVEDFKFSENKIEALRLIPNENMIENLFDISIYKNRWSEITKADILYPLKNHFNEYFGYTDGYPTNEHIYEREMYFTNEMTVIDDERLEYLYKIFDLAEENNIEVLLVKTPYYETKEEYKMTNYLFSLAKERGYLTLNLNQYYPQLDFVFDRDGDIWHCNVRGSWKISRMISEFIKNHYQISVFESIYDQQYKTLYKKTMQSLLWSQYDVYQYLEYVSNLDVTLLVNYRAKDECYVTDYQWSLLEKTGIERFDTQKNYIAVIQDQDILYLSQDGENVIYDMRIENIPVSYQIQDQQVAFYYQNQEYKINYQGINLIVIDNVSGDVIDMLCLDTMGYFQILR